MTIPPLSPEAVDLDEIDAFTRGLLRARSLFAQAWVDASRSPMEEVEFTYAFVGDEVSRYERCRAALQEIANRWEDDTEHSRTHDPETCDVVVCVAKRALNGGGVSR